MLKIKLTRIGKKGDSHYRIVVAEQRSKRDGRFIDTLGFYTPQTQPATVKIDRVKLHHWLKHGAQPTDIVKVLLKKHGPAA